MLRTPRSLLHARVLTALTIAGVVACDEGAAPIELDPGDYVVTVDDPVPAIPLDAVHPLHAGARRRLVDLAIAKGSASGILDGMLPLPASAAVAKADLWAPTTTVAKPALTARDQVSTAASSLVTTEGLKTSTLGTKSYPDGTFGNGCTKSPCATSTGTVSYSNARVWSADSQWLLIGNQLRHRRYGFQWVEAVDTDTSDPGKWTGTYHSYLSAFGKVRFWSRVQPATMFAAVRPQTERLTYQTWTSAGWTAGTTTLVDAGNSQEDDTTRFVEPTGCTKEKSARFAFAEFFAVSCSPTDAASNGTWTNLPATVLAAVNLTQLTRDGHDPSTYPNLITAGNASFQSPERAVNRLLYTQLRADSQSKGYDFFEKHGCRRLHFPMAQEPFTTGAMEQRSDGVYAPILEQTGSGKFVERLLLYCDRPANWQTPGSTDPDYSGWDAPAGDLDASGKLDYRDIVRHNAELYYETQTGQDLAISNWADFFKENAACGSNVNCFLAKVGVKKNRNLQHRQFADLTPFLEGAKYEGDVILDVRIASARVDGGDAPANYQVSVKETQLLDATRYTIGGHAVSLADFPVDYVNACTGAACYHRVAFWGAWSMPGGGWALVALQLLQDPTIADDKAVGDDKGRFLIAFARLDLDLAHAHELQIATINSHSSMTRVAIGDRHYDAYVQLHSNHATTNGTQAAVSAVLLPDDAAEPPLHNEILPAGDVVAGTDTRLTGSSLGGMASFTHLSCGAAVPSDWSQWCVLSTDGLLSPYGDQYRTHPLNGFESGAFGEDEVVAVDVTGIVERTSVALASPSAVVRVGASSRSPFVGQIWNDRSNIAKLVWARQAALSGQVYDLGTFANMSPDLTMVTWNSSWMPDKVLDIARATDLDENGDGTRETLSRCGENGVWKTPCAKAVSGLMAEQSSTASCNVDTTCIDGSDHQVLWSLQTFLSSGLVSCSDGNAVSGDGCSSSGWVEPCAPESTLCKSAVPAACNDGNVVDGDGCASEGYVEFNTVSSCSDGNTIDGDGCEAEGYKQRCSDGNSTNGDGCSSAKLVEASGSRVSVQAPEKLDRFDHLQAGGSTA